ncbi:helix-turn-helix domain-containing protein [Sporosalibacterium faouarense]|uniref:helix-turn-helix domain-containing protein n=1 Tax=Sporosalibacterium faouarense TaxID=516123 RepID=UPI00192AA4CD
MHKEEKCKAKTPLKQNTLFFDSAHEALKEGFRPCKLCRPDIDISNFDKRKELMSHTREMLDRCYDTNININCVAKSVGLSKRHLMRLFKADYGITINEYINELRIAKSKDLLTNSNNEILDIVYEVGFKSISNFYKCFKEKVGISPKKYREKMSRDKDLI